MADAKLTALSAINAISSGDLFYVVDGDTGTTPDSYKVTADNLQAVMANPFTNDGRALGSGSLKWSDLFLASGGTINFNNSGSVLSESSQNLSYAATKSGTLTFTIQNSDAGTSGAGLQLFHFSATPAVNDNVGRIDFIGMDTGGGLNTYGTIRCQIANVFPGEEAGQIIFAGVTAGVGANQMILDGSNLRPASNDQIGLGSATVSWADLFLADSGVISWGNNDITLTQFGQYLRLGGATAFQPSTQDGAALGDTGQRWSDLYLASGAVTDYGDTGTGVHTITKSTHALTIADTEWRLMSGTANLAPLRFNTGGTLTTDNDSGMITYAAAQFYGGSNSGKAGILPVEYWIRLHADYTLADSTSPQKLFNQPTNGALTIAAGAYYFQCLLNLTGMSATTGNLSFSIVGAGTATVTNVLQSGWGSDTGTGVSATGPISGSAARAALLPATNGNIVLAGTAAEVWANIIGTFEVSTGGTIIPSIDLVTGGVTPAVKIGSYFMCKRIGAETTTTLGNWA